MTYEEFLARPHLTKEEILAMAYGRLIDDPPENFKTRLPAPPMLMIDRVVEMSANGRKGRIVGEMDIPLDAWFFQCHFTADPVQPGCLGVDAVWQLIGLYCTWRGAMGTGRALGSGEIEFLARSAHTTKTCVTKSTSSVTSHYPNPDPRSPSATPAYSWTAKRFTR